MSKNDLGLSLRHLRLIAAVAATGQIGTAAQHIGVSQPAASRLLAEVELILGHPVHSRLGRGIILTAQGAALARRAGRVLIEMGDAARELAEIGAGTGGHVRIGAITGAALDRVLPVVRHARLALPDISIDVEVGPSDQLTDMITQGRIDFALCRIPANSDPADFSFAAMGDEMVNLVVRRDHSLMRQADLAPADLMQFDWVLPKGGAILRLAVLARLADLGLAAPPGRLTTSSFLLTLAILGHSNAIAPLARSVAEHFGTGPDAAYASLPIDLGIRMSAYGIVTRAGAALTPAAQRIRDMMTSDKG